MKKVEGHVRLGVGVQAVVVCLVDVLIEVKVDEYGLHIMKEEEGLDFIFRL